MVALNQLAVHSPRWDAILDLSLQIVVARLQFVLITRLIADLNRQALLLTHLVGEIS